MTYSPRPVEGAVADLICRAGYRRKTGCERLSFPAVKGERRMNPATFCETYTQGRYICRVAKHVFAVIDGVVHDEIENRPDRCIYLAWRIPLDNPVTRMVYDET